MATNWNPIEMRYDWKYGIAPAIACTGAVRNIVAVANQSVCSILLTIWTEVDKHAKKNFLFLNYLQKFCEYKIKIKMNCRRRRIKKYGRKDDMLSVAAVVIVPATEMFFAKNFIFRHRFPPHGCLSSFPVWHFPFDFFSMHEIHTLYFAIIN